MEKYKRQEVSPVEEENERDESYRASNPNIDGNRTNKNYHIIHPFKSYIEIINSRLAQLELKRKIRSDAILMNSFVVTSDGAFFEGLRPWEQQNFFKDCVQFFKDKYGKENMISAIVHLDETTPHLHLNFVPVNGGRLSSKSLFDRQKLTQLQTELWEQIGKKYGLQRGKSGSSTTHLSSAEYMAKKMIDDAEQRSAEIDEQTEKKKTKLADLTHTIYAVTEAQNQPIPKKKNEIAEEIKTLRTKNAALKKENEIKSKDNADLFKQMQKTQKRNEAAETALSMVSDIMAVNPESFKKLLADARQKKSMPPSSFHGNRNNNSK